MPQSKKPSGNTPRSGQEKRGGWQKPTKKLTTGKGPAGLPPKKKNSGS